MKLTTAINIVRALAVTACLFCLTGLAFAQPVGVGDNSHAVVVKHSFGKKRTPKSHKDQAEIDAAHKAALNKIKSPPAPTDPWATVRPGN